MYLVVILAAILNFSSTENFSDVYHQKSVSTRFSVNIDIQFIAQYLQVLVCTVHTGKNSSLGPLTFLKPRAEILQYLVSLTTC